MLTLYRRHKPTCPHFAEGRRYHHCKCAIWADGVLAGREVRKSLRTRDWTKANREVQKWEATELACEREAPVSIGDAWERFLADAAARKLTEASIYKYELLSRQMESFAEKCGYRFLSELTVDTLSAFRASWKDGALSSLKKLERLRTFFGFALKRKWVSDNPALELKAPKVQIRPTMPFTHDEMADILAAIGNYAGKTAHNGKINALRMRSLVLLLRYSGLRIGDAVSLTTNRINGNRLFLYTAKTGTPVFTVLPEFVVRSLESMPRMTERYYFWTGAGKLCTAVRVWDMRLKRIFDQAKLVRGHAHRFRDTFAVELLLAGVPMERVSMLLGHSSIRVTERHYSPWVRSRQEQLEADLERAWADDPVIASEMAGTKKVQFPKDRVN